MNTAPPSRNAWKRLRRNKGAMFGIVIISISIIIAIGGYLFSPDSTPYANRMIVEIGGQKPGFTQSFLKVPLANTPEAVSGIVKMANGAADSYQYIPIQKADITNDSVIVQQYIDEDTSTRVAWSLAALNPSNQKDYSPVITQKFYLGTDKYGRDILSRLLIGVRVSLSVGMVTVLISLTLGVLLGAFAGYFRGKTDDIIMWFINVIWSIPTLLLVFAITLLLGKGFWQVLIAIGLTMWVNVARIVRGQVLAQREMEYVEAARALGFSSFRIILKHILPNVMGPVLVVAASNFASAIVIEAGLSFLGIGVQPPQPSWGLMIKENFNFIITHNPMLALAPGFAIMLLVLAFNLLGNGLRDALAVKE
ncbi:MAG: ABC transporter permease [Chitinophagaceae bacterium]|nr:ABC transporter permease [Chitinophagaceae bacterium]